MTSSLPVNSLPDPVQAWQVQEMNQTLELLDREQPVGHTLRDRAERSAKSDLNFSLTTEQTNKLCQHYNPQLTPHAVTWLSLWRLLPGREGSWKLFTPSDLRVQR